MGRDVCLSELRIRRDQVSLLVDSQASDGFVLVLAISSGFLHVVFDKCPLHHKRTLCIFPIRFQLGNPLVKTCWIAFLQERASRHGFSQRAVSSGDQVHRCTFEKRCDSLG